MLVWHPPISHTGDMHVVPKGELGSSWYYSARQYQPQAKVNFLVILFSTVPPSGSEMLYSSNASKDRQDPAAIVLTSLSYILPGGAQYSVLEPRQIP